MTDGLEQFDEEDRARFAAMRLRDDVLDFLRSPVGRFLHGRAKMDLEAAKVDLLGCSFDSWWGRRKAARIQARARTAQTVLQYCIDAIQDGYVAEKELTDET